jgi:mxaA protein
MSLLNNAEQMNMKLPVQPFFSRCLFTLVCLSFSQLIYADVKLPSIDEKYVTLKLEDPARDAGYVVGDILSRKVTITIKKPYQLIKESVPIVGYEHRYKGQTSGIELVNIDMSSKENADSETHILNLSYQVFTTSRVAKPAALRAEMLKMRNTENTKQIVEYRVPSFAFRVSPLSVYGQVKLDEELYPFTPPLTLDNNKEMANVKVLAATLTIALLGLLYIFGTRAWLPRMGAPFAKAYRDIKKMPDTPEGLQQAVTRVHQSLNETMGGSVFNNNLDAFMTKKPAFLPAKQEIEKFLGLSHQVFFQEASHPLSTNNPKAWLLALCLHLRHCERGLVPNAMQGNNI